MKIEKISSRVLLACVVVIVICFGAFMTIGYDNPVGDNNEPMLTDVIMWLMYLLIAATAALTIWSAVRGIQNNKGNDPAATTGVPGGKITLCTMGLLVVSLIIGWICGLGEDADHGKGHDCQDRKYLFHVRPPILRFCLWGIVLLITISSFLRWHYPDQVRGYVLRPHGPPLDILRLNQEQTLFKFFLCRYTFLFLKASKSIESILFLLKNRKKVYRPSYYVLVFPL